MLNRINKNIMFNTCLTKNGHLMQWSICHNNWWTKAYTICSVDDEDNLSKIEESIESKITPSSHSDICQIIAELLKTASQKLKYGKLDPLLTMTSNFFSNAPPILSDMLAATLWGYITHAHVSDFLLVSNLIPIVKDKLADQ